MGKQKRPTEQQPLSPFELEVIKAKQQIAPIEALKPFGKGDSLGWGGYDYDSMGYGKAAKGYTSSWYKPYDEDRAKWNTFALPEDMALKAFEQQNFGELVGDVVTGGAKRFGAGFLDSIGAWDVSNMTAMAMNKADVDYSNWFNTVGKKLTDNANEVNTIFQNPDGSIWNTPYWANQTQQLGYTGGIIAEMVAENALLDVVTGGAGAAASVASKTKLLTNLGKDALFGMAQGVKEAHMNALETQNNTYEKFKSLGFSDEESLTKSREAANLHFKTEAGALAVMNGLQNMLFLGSLARSAKGSTVDKVFGNTDGFKLGFSDAFETVGSKLSGKFTSKIANEGIRKGVDRAVGAGILAGSEAVEEGIQTGIGTYAARSVEGKDTSASDLFAGNDMRDSMIGGALGGILLGAGFKATSNLRNKDFNNNYKDFIQDTLNRSKQAFEKEDLAVAEYERAQKEYANIDGTDTPSNAKVRANYETAKLKRQQAQDATHLSTIVSALAFDYGKKSGSTVAFDMYTKHLQDVLEATKNSDTEALTNFGIIDKSSGKERFTGALKTINETYEQRIQDAEKLKELYTDTLGSTVGDFNVATGIVQNKFGIYKNQQDINKYKENIEDSYSRIEAYKDLSKEGQARLRLQDEKRGLRLNSEVSKSQYSKDRIEEINEELAANSKYSAKDARIINESGLGSARGGNMLAQFNHMITGELIRANERLSQEVDKQSSPEEIKKQIEASRKKEIQKAKTKEEVQEIVDNAPASTAIQEVAQEKINKIVAQENMTPEEVKYAQPVSNPSVIQQPTNSVEPALAQDINYDVEGLAEVDDISDIFGPMNIDTLPLGMGTEEDAQNEALSSRQTTPTGVSDKINTMVSGLDNFYSRAQGRESGLKDFIHEMIHHNGLQPTKKNYSKLVKAYAEATSRDVSDAQNIYNEIYTLPQEILEDLSDSEVNEKNQVIETQVKEDLGKKEVTPEGNVISYSIEEDRRTNSPAMKAAHNYQTSQRDSEGNWTVTEDTLSPAELVDNLYALDPAFIRELYINNAELNIRVRDENSAKVTLPDGTKSTWGELKSRLNPQTDQWYNNVPMVAYLGDIPLFNIHNPSWYNESNISEAQGKDAQIETIKQGYANVSGLRQRVAQGQNVIKVSDYRFGNIDKLNEHVNSAPRTISEAAGSHSTLAVVTISAQAGKNFMVSPTESFNKKYPNGIIAGNTTLDSLKGGELIEFRPITQDKETGNTIYFPAKVLNYSPIAEGNMKQDLQENIFNNVKYATLSYFLFENQNNATIRQRVEEEFNFTLSEAEEIRSNISQNTGIDIKFQAGDYVNLFLQNARLGDRKSQDMTYFENTNYTSKNKGRQIQGIDFFFNDIKSSTIGKVDEGYESTAVKNVIKFLKDTDTQPALLKKAKFSVNKKGLGSDNFKVSGINSDGRLTGDTQSYTDFAKSNLYTNILSHEITDITGQTKWITDIQPMIYFESVDSNSNSIPDVDIVQQAQPTSQVDVNDQASISEQDVNNLLTSELRQQLFDAGLTQEDINIMLANGTLSAVSNVLTSRLVATPEVSAVFDVLSTNKISSLSEQEHKDLVQSLKNILIDNLDFSKKIYLADIARASVGIVNETINPLIEQTNKRIESLSKVPALAQFVEKEKAYLSKLETIIAEKDKLTRFSKLESEDGSIQEVGDIIREFNKLLGTRVDEIDETNLEDVNTDQSNYEAEDENYSMSSLEKNVKLSFTNELRLKLLGIPLQKDKTREAVLNTLGLPQYNTADEVLLRLQEITTSIGSDWNSFLDRLEQRYTETSKPIYIQIRDQFKGMEDHIKNQLLHKLIQEPVTLYKVLISEETERDNKGIPFVTNTNITILDENSSRESLVLKKLLENDFILNQNNNLGYVISDSNANKRLDLEYTIQKQAELQTFITDNEGINKATVADIYKLFDNYGLFRIRQNTVDKYISEVNPFQSKRGVFYFINEQLKDLIARETQARTKGSNLDMSLRENSIFTGANSAINRIINTDISINGTDVAKSIRIDGKTLQGASNSTMIQDTLNSLTKDSSGRLMDILTKSKLAENNFVLNMILQDESFRNNTALSWTSPDFIKKHNRDNFSSAEIDSLGQLDYYSALFGAYANVKGFSKLNTSDSFYQGLKFRLAQMTTTTFADKGRMMLWTTAVVDAKRGQIEFTPEGDVTLNPVLGNFLYEQLFLPEFNRIVESYKMSKEGKPSDIIGYDEASKVFLGLPMFNYLETEIDGSAQNILAAIENDLVDPSRFKQQAINSIQRMLTYGTNNKISVDGTSGTLVDIGMYNPNTKEIEIEVSSGGETGKKIVKESPFKNIPDSFINSKPGENELERFRFAMVEYQINTLLNQQNMYSLFLGDQAFYSKDKFVRNAIKSGDFSALSEAISLVIDKRAAMLIAPGAKLANSEVQGLKSYNTEYNQVFVNDVEEASKYIDKFLESQYGEMNQSQKDSVSEIKRLSEQIQDKYNQFTSTEANNILQQEINDLTNKKNKLLSDLADTAPDIADYFNITGTDAQEYSTWKSHLDALYRKGDLTVEEREMVKSAYEKLSQGKFTEVSVQEYKIVMQPLKTVYTGVIDYTNPLTGARLARPMYIKSSTIPLLPHVTQNTKMDEVRKKLESLEDSKGSLVKMSYQTANKIGASKTSLTMNDLYHKPLESISDLLDTSMVTLPTSGLRIQQETPYKQGKYFSKGEDPYISMGSQFMKVIMGNGVNKMGEVFKAEFFNKYLLSELEMNPDKTRLSGSDLESIYNHAYKEYSDLNKQVLFDEFGIDPRVPFESLSIDQQFEVLSNLVKVLENEIMGRGYPDYMHDSLVVVKDEILKDREFANFNLPLIFDANANKFESLMQSIVSNRLISHKLPGNGHISASAEGFSRKASLDEISVKDKSGIVWVNGIVEDLEPTYLDTKDGVRTLTRSKVLIPSHYAYTDREGNRQYVDFQSEEYSEPIYEDGKIVGRKLNLEKIEPELLSMFAFRIPTSSHQSGTIIEVAGFLPQTMGDTLVVPKEHTTQLGEDYDIDKRYVYKSNYYINKEGVIKKVQYRSNSITEEDTKSQRLFKNNRRIKGIENTLIDVYKTVFNSDSDEVQKRVFKPLVTEIADRTANLIQQKQRLDSTENREFFSNLSDDYQYYLMKLGADGKGGIGQHSNGVTMQAQFDRAPDTAKVKLLDGNGNTRSIRFGSVVSTGTLGASTKAVDSEYDVSDQHGENQNVSTDNINKQIMIKRNENSYTMSVYATMAFRGIYTSPEDIRTGLFDSAGKEIIGKNLSIPSLFMSQPILIDYVKLRAKYDSITGDFTSKKDIDRIILETLSKEYGFGLQQESDGSIDTSSIIPMEVYEQGQDIMTGQKLFDNLTKKQAIKNPMLQASTLQTFLILQKEAEVLQKYNGLINLSTSKLGISNFNNIQRINILNDIAYDKTEGIQNIGSLIGDSQITEYLTAGDKAELISQGYVELGQAMWKPTTIEGTMLINSLHAAGNVVETLFPYKSAFVNDTIETIFKNNDKDPNQKSQANLEWKYEIMNSMRDFFYTLNSSKMFDNVEQERARLFLDNEGNMSLAAIINKLKIDNNDIVINNTLLRDMEVVVRFDGLPSLVQHFAASNESFDKSIKYEAFKNLLSDDKTILGTFNNEEYTPRKLAFDLFSYAYLADTQKGASSFRNYIHYSFLENMGITRGLRKIYYGLLNGDTSRIMPLFMTQYLQHNPNRAAIMSAKTYTWKDFKNMNQEASGTQNFDTAIGKLKEFTLDGNPKRTYPDFISIRDTSQAVDNKNKKFKLFRRSPEGVYTQIDVLGDTGYNEYDANFQREDPKETSLVKNKRAQGKLKEANLVARQFSDPDNKAITNADGAFKELHTVQGIVDAYLRAKSTPTESPAIYKFLTEAKDLVHKDVKIEFVIPKSGALGEYNILDNKIYIHPSIWELLYNKHNGDISKARIAMREVLVEELIHSTTAIEFRKYVESEDLQTGFVKLKPDAPLFATRLLALYSSVKAEVPYVETDQSTYYSKNIYEFMAGMFVAEDYRNNVESKSSGIVQRFLDIVRTLFRNLYTQQTGQVLDYKSQMFNDVKDLMKSYQDSFVQTEPEVQESTLDVQYQDIIQLTRDELLSDDNLESRQNFSNFAEAFKCK